MFQELHHKLDECKSQKNIHISQRIFLGVFQRLCDHSFQERDILSEFHTKFVSQMGFLKMAAPSMAHYKTKLFSGLQRGLEEVFQLPTFCSFR